MQWRCSADPLLQSCWENVVMQWVLGLMGQERGCWQKRGGTHLSQVLLLIHLCLIPPSLCGSVWSHFPGLCDPEVLCSRSCFRRTHSFHFQFYFHLGLRSWERWWSRQPLSAWSRKSCRGAWGGAFPSRSVLHLLLPFAFSATTSPDLALLPPSRYSLALCFSLSLSQSLSFNFFFFSPQHTYACEQCSVRSCVSVGGSSREQSSRKGLPKQHFPAAWRGMKKTKLCQMTSGTKYPLL